MLPILVAEPAGSLTRLPGGNPVLSSPWKVAILCDTSAGRRWKQWVQSKIMTMDKLPKAAHGAFIFTLLQGKAMEVVEHLRESEYQEEGGDKVLLDLLDKRWPQKDRADELGEHVSEVFLLAAKDGEICPGLEHESSGGLRSMLSEDGCVVPRGG